MDLGTKMKKPLKLIFDDSNDEMETLPDPKGSDSDSNSEHNPKHMELDESLNLHYDDSDDEVETLPDSKDSDSNFEHKPKHMGLDESSTEKSTEGNFLSKKADYDESLIDESFGFADMDSSYCSLDLSTEVRTSTPNFPNSTDIFGSPVRHGYKNSQPYSPDQSPSCLRRKPSAFRVTPMLSLKTPKRSRTRRNRPYSPMGKRQKMNHSDSLSSTPGAQDSIDSGRGASGLFDSDNSSSRSRYMTDFLHQGELASGRYGQVQLVQHKLDKKLYAIKVNKEKVKSTSAAGKKLREEVEAHATLNTSKYVVKYFNSWKEDGYVYIQNEFCDGGSFMEMIQRKRENVEHFTEDQLILVFTHSLEGLKYIHENQMAHLDIKPDNILISLNLSNPERTNMTIDSGAESDDPCALMKKMELKEAQASEITYKIGDLGHTRHIKSKKEIDIGDCRYLAPELLHSWNPDTSAVQKADIFSLGCSIFEAASLKPLPKEGSFYAEIRKGKLTYLPDYSEKLNNILRSMIKEKPQDRPTASDLLKLLTEL